MELITNPYYIMIFFAWMYVFRKHYCNSWFDICLNAGIWVGFTSFVLGPIIDKVFP